MIRSYANLSSIIHRRALSFSYAFNGIKILLTSQPNARIHLIITFGVAGAGLLLGISLLEWSVIVLAMIAVWCAEALNTAIELLADAAIPEVHPLVKQAKDVAAGAVLLAAVGSILIGLLIFSPYIIRCLSTLG